MKNAREAAFKILLMTDFGGAYSNLALKSNLDGLSAVDKGLATKLVYGCISMRITLDYIISQFSKTKIQKLSNNVHEILRLGIYQIYFMDKIPDSAAVNESVNLASRYATVSKGFVNGVLRSAVRGKDSISYPEEKTEFLRTRYSFPKKLCDKFIAEFGFDKAESIIKSLLDTPETTIRANRLKTDADSLIKLLTENGVNASKSPLASDCITVTGLDVGSSPEFKKGFYTVQDTAAQLACLVLNPQKGDTVIDMCAAPGGKTTYLAELMDNEGVITAFDIYPHKTELIDENAERLGIDIINTCACDSGVYKTTLENRADKVLADVPCSGLGIIRRKPDIKWNRDDMSTLPEIQKKILENAVRYAKPGGEIVYSTCTILAEENEEIVNQVLSENKNIETVDITDLLPDSLKRDEAKKGYITLFPDTDGTDGFFICKLRKKS